MASNLQYNDLITTTALPDSIRTIYSAELDYTAAPLMVFDQFAERKTEHAMQHGQTAVWSIIRQMPPTIGTLQETVDVDTQQIQDFQVQMSVYEYGNAVGTTEKLNLLSYWGPISDIVKRQLAPQMARTFDIIARNVAWAGATKRYAGAATSRSTLTDADVATVDLLKQSAHKLRNNRIMPRDGGYVCVAHPSVIYDLREDPLWEDAGRYADPSRLATGEVGRLFGVRFVESDWARLPNAGTSSAQTTLSGAHSFNSSVLSVASASGFAVGDEITLFASGQSTPDGTGTTEENVIIKDIDGNDLTLEYATSIAHANGDKVRKGVDVFPMMFLGHEDPYGKSIVQAPEVRVALPTDKLRRFHYVGWYALLGYGVLRDWSYLVVEAAASQSSSYIFGF